MFALARIARASCLSIAVCLAISASSDARAQTGSAQGTIQYVYTYGNGMVLFVGPYFAQATCSNKSGFFIAPDHPHFSRLLAVLLAAKASGATVEVVAKIDNCWYPEITSDASTYFVVLPQ
jgi:hypothetical protein